jgi:hypothetical protein
MNMRQQNLHRLGWLAVAAAALFGTTAAVADSATTNTSTAMQVEQELSSLTTPSKPQLGLTGASNSTITTPGPAGAGTSTVATPTRFWIKRGAQGDRLPH